MGAQWLMNTCFAGEKRLQLMQFPLYKIFLIVAAFALSLGVLSPFGIVETVFGFIIGSLISAIILISQKKDLIRIFGVALGSLLGAAMGTCCLGHGLMVLCYGYDHGSGETAKSMVLVAIIGAIAGGIAMSILMKKRML